jgi:hypothetical protein
VEGEERKEKAKGTVASEMGMRIRKKMWWEEANAWSRERDSEKDTIELYGSSRLRTADRKRKCSKYVLHAPNQIY